MESLEVPGYQILAELGSGASGTVCLAVQESLGREVALKVLAPGLFGLEETRTRFLREARLQAQLAHPNLLRIFDAGFVGSRPYLVTELVQGGTLRELLDERGRLSVSDACRLGAEIAGGLAITHLAGIVHRDLKPENVLLDGAYQAKVADFGLAKAVAAHQTAETAQGVILGTPGYVAPEVVCGQPATAAADVYALGAILFEMTAGVRAFQAGSVGELLRLQLSDRVPELAELRGDAPEALARLARSCLQRRLEGRPAARDVASELLALGTKLESEADTKTVPLESARAARPGGAARSDRAPAPAAGSECRPEVRRRQATSREAMRAAAAPSETGRRQTLRVSRERAAAAASSTQAEPPEGSLKLRLLALLGGVLLVALLFTASRLARTGSSTPVPPAVASAASSNRPVLAGSAPPSSIPAITVGAREAHLQWEAPLPANLSLACQHSKRHQETRTTVPRGDSEAWLRGLEPASAYRLLVGTGPAEVTTTFSTLPESGRGRMTRLADGACEYPELRCRGARVALLWVQGSIPGVSILCLRESPDGGRTWGPIEQVTPREYIREPELAYLEHGTCLAWVSLAPGQLRTQFRPEGSRYWRASVPLAVRGAFPGLAICSGPDSDLWLLMTVAGKAGVRKGRLMRWTCEPGGVPRLQDDLRNSSLPGAEYLRLESTSAGLLALGTESDRGPFRSVLADLPGARWSPLSTVGVQSGRIREYILDVAQREGVVVLAREHLTSILIHSSRDGGLTFEPMAELGAGAAELLIRPALVATADRFFLAAYEYQPPVQADLRILSSRDARSWVDTETVALDPLISVSKLRAVVAGERLLVMLAHEGSGGLDAISLPTAGLRTR